MTGCTVKELCAAVGRTLLQQSGAVVTPVSTDSRSIPNRALFVPLVGERFDGHDYLDAALERGAAGCLTAKKPAALLKDKFYIQVSDTLEALKALGRGIGRSLIFPWCRSPAAPERPPPRR